MGSKHRHDSQKNLQKDVNSQKVILIQSELRRFKANIYAIYKVYSRTILCCLVQFIDTK